MDDAIRLLQIQGVSVVGVLLFVLFFVGVGLHREWFVTGKRWASKVADCEKLSTALEAATATNRQCEHDYTETRITLARLEERELMHKHSAPRGRGS